MLFDFDNPDRFVAGTVGQPGERTFYLQATTANRTISVALEKVQVATMAEKLAELVDQVRRTGVSIAAEAAKALEDVAPLDGPIEEEFRVGTIGLGWDPDDSVFVIEASDQEAEPEDTEASMLRVRLTPERVLAFVARAQRVVAAGRPPCPLCGLPLDPEGHVCPRQNGHRH